MATIKFDIDTEPGPSKLEGKSLHGKLAASLKVGLLSSITVTDDMLCAFNKGVGSDTEKEDNAGYKRTDIKDKKKKLKDLGNKVIATAGGSIVLSALVDESGITMPPFVSLVGTVPTFPLGNCRGGVSLESYNTNRVRRDYLKALGGGGVHTNATIVLLTNSNTQWHISERDAWNYPGTFLESYVGDGSGNNYSNRFQWDFVGDAGPPEKPKKIPDAATAIIISDDVFFQRNRAILIPLANTWLDGHDDRRIIYPSKIYQSEDLPASQRPRRDKSIIIGPDLLRAYMLLGALAGSLAKNDGLQFGFFTLPNETIIIGA